MLLLVLEVHFSLLLQTTRILGCVLWCVKSGRHCFSCRSLLLGTSVPNDEMKAHPQSTIPDKSALHLPFYVMCKLSANMHTMALLLYYSFLVKLL